MGLAEELRDELLEGGAPAVRALDGQMESLHLECKSQLAETAESLAHFAKTASAFLNTEGGVLLWGVDARFDRDERRDRVSGFPGIESVERRVSWLRTKTSGVLFPTASGMDHYAISGEDTGSDFVLTYVPMSATPPHRAHHGKSDYYLRTPASSEPMPHGVLAAMFGRRPAPSIRVLVSLFGLDLTPGSSRTLSLLLSARNAGLAPARAPYMTIRDASSPPSSIRTYSRVHAESAGHFFVRAHRQHGSSEFDASYTATDSVLVAPADAIGVCVALVHLPWPIERRLDLRGVVGAVDCPPVSWRLQVDGPLLERTTGQTLDKEPHVPGRRRGSRGRVSSGHADGRRLPARSRCRSAVSRPTSPCERRLSACPTTPAPFAAS